MLKEGGRVHAQGSHSFGAGRHSLALGRDELALRDVESGQVSNAIRRQTKGAAFVGWHWHAVALRVATTLIKPIILGRLVFLQINVETT